MSDTTETERRSPASVQHGWFGGFLRATELDTRLIGMIGALAVIWIGFHMGSAWRISGSPFNWDAGVFLTPRNLWNLSVQTASIAVMATGMVLVIVTRNIDLSVGSVLGFVGMVMGVTQAEFLPQYLGFDSAWTWPIALIVGMVVGSMIGAAQGFVIAYLAVPAFIVTLGGLMIWRGAAWWVTFGRTVAPMDTTFRLLGGGTAGSIGATASWIIGVVTCLLIVAAIANGRHQRRRFRFPLRPVWAEVTLVAMGCTAVMGAIAIANSYPWPVRVARAWADANGIDWPDGGMFIAHGIAVPVLVALGVGVVMTFIATRTRFGRYVFAIGGNPEAAELAGVNTRLVTLKVFMLMGALIGIASAIATARLNAATNATGMLDELYTIAAAVIGGTSLGGGIGTVAGAILGALVMQSLQSGMVLMGLATPLQQIVVGAVLILAVFVDGVYRRRTR